MSWFRLPWRQRGGTQRSCEPSATLALLLPDDLTEGEFADGVQCALVHSRDALADRARHHADLAEQEQQDEVHRAYLIGGSEAFNEAASRIDAAVADAFGISAQRPDRR